MKYPECLITINITNPPTKNSPNLVSSSPRTIKKESQNMHLLHIPMPNESFSMAVAPLNNGTWGKEEKTHMKLHLVN